jgi:alpha-aminoadipate/glutamate carrier protein LysW
MATCPECDAEIDIDEDDLEELDTGDPWDCDACGTRLRVVNLDPLDFESDDDDEDEDEDEEEEKKEDDDDVEIEDDDVDDEEDGEDWDE